MVILASAAPRLPSFEQLQKRLEARRQRLENMRSLNARRLQQDIKRIASGEFDFAKSLLREMLPFDIKVNEEAMKNLPITLEWKEDFITSPPTPSSIPTPTLKSESDVDEDVQKQ